VVVWPRDGAVYFGGFRPRPFPLASVDHDSESLPPFSRQLWDYNSVDWAGKFLDEWYRQVMRSRIEPMKKIARSLRQHRELILNYFRAQKLLSSGVVEGLNNKAKVTMRKSYGFRTFRCLELALYHSLGKLPEPKSTHEFF
jgi:transposase